MKGAKSFTYKCTCQVSDCLTLVVDLLQFVRAWRRMKYLTNSHRLFVKKDRNINSLQLIWEEEVCFELIGAGDIYSQKIDCYYFKVNDR